MNCMADSKENHERDHESQRVKAGFSFVFCCLCCIYSEVTRRIELKNRSVPEVLLHRKKTKNKQRTSVSSLPQTPYRFRFQPH